MLVIDAAPSPVPALAGSWPDSDDPGVRWAQPAGLVLASQANAAPRFLLARWRDPVAAASGGVLHLALARTPPAPDLAAAAAAAGLELRTTSFSAVRFRLILRAVGTDVIRALGQWRDTPPAADPLVVASDPLDPDTAQLLTAALSGGGDAVEVVVEARGTGLAGSLDALVVVDLPRLVPLLDARMSPASDGGETIGITVDDLIATLASLPEDPQLVQVRPLDGAPAPAGAAALAELAHRLVDDLFTPVGSADPWSPRRFRLTPGSGTTQSRAYDLRPSRLAPVPWRASWSLSDWAAGLAPTAREALFPVLERMAVFGTAPVVVVCEVPVDPQGVREVQVDVTAPGVGGVPDHRSFSFTGSSSVARFTAAFPAFSSPATPSARAAATLVPAPGAIPAWPRVLPTRPVPADGPLITVTPADLGLTTVVVAAESAVFTRASRLELAVRAGELMLATGTLTGTSLSATLAFPQPAELPGAPLLVITAVRDPEGSAFRLPGHPLNGRPVTVAAVDLEDLSPIEVTIELDDPAGRVAYAAVALLDTTGRSRTLTLDAGTPTTWTCHRPTALDPLRYRWRLHHVTRGPDGNTRPLATTPWADASTTHLVLPAPT
jgi:hypothetical protein